VVLGIEDDHAPGATSARLAGQGQTAGDARGGVRHEERFALARLAHHEPKHPDGDAPLPQPVDVLWHEFGRDDDTPGERVFLLARRGVCRGVLLHVIREGFTGRIAMRTLPALGLRTLHDGAEANARAAERVPLRLGLPLDVLRALRAPLDKEALAGGPEAGTQGHAEAYPLLIIAVGVEEGEGALDFGEALGLGRGGGRRVVHAHEFHDSFEEGRALGDVRRTDVIAREGDVARVVPDFEPHARGGVKNALMVHAGWQAPLDENVHPRATGAHLAIEGLAAQEGSHRFRAREPLQGACARVYLDHVVEVDGDDSVFFRVDVARARAGVVLVLFEVSIHLVEGAPGRGVVDARMHARDWVRRHLLIVRHPMRKGQGFRYIFPPCSWRKLGNWHAFCLLVKPDG